MNKCEHDNRGKEKIKNLDALEQTLNLIKIGKGKGELRRLLNLSPSALSNRLKRLENLGCINLIGKYQIEVTGSSLKHPKVTRALVNKKLNKRGHGHNATILFPKEDNLWEKDRVKKEFAQKKITRLGFGSYKLSYKGFTIWINKKSLTIYSSNSYFSKDALKSKFWALKDLDNLAKYLRGRFDIKGIYGLKIFREHYGIIFNKFAEWLLGQKRKMHVKEKGEESILWIDDSIKDNIGAKVKLKEFEGKDPQKINSVDDWGKDMDNEGWPLVSDIKGNAKKTSKLLLESAKQTKENAENLAYHAENMRSHVGATQDLSKAATTLNSNIEKQNKLFERMAAALEKNG